MGIYCLTNKVNNKKYFGQTIDLERREKEYFNYGYFHNDHLKRAFNKYGKENFKFEIIKVCKEKYLDRFEKLYIRIYDTMNKNKGYNKESGGNLNKHLSDETRKKISESLSGENHPDCFGKNNNFYGKKHTPESRKKMSEAQSGENNGFYGKHHSDESKKKIGDSNRGENSAFWKDYPRITKAGKTRQGKRRYRIVYNGKRFAESISKERLYKKWYELYPDIELIDETK